MKLPSVKPSSLFFYSRQILAAVRTVEDPIDVRLHDLPGTAAVGLFVYIQIHVYIYEFVTEDPQGGIESEVESEERVDIEVEGVRVWHQ